MKKIIFAVLVASISSGIYAETYGKWESFEQVDEIDDSVRTGAYTDSRNTNFPYRAALYVFCVNGERMQANILNIGYYPASNSPFSVILRADKKPSYTEKWSALSSNDGIGKYEATGLVKTFKKANNVVIRTDSGIGGADTWKFSAVGFSEAISKASHQRCVN